MERTLPACGDGAPRVRQYPRRPTIARIVLVRALAIALVLAPAALVRVGRPIALVLAPAALARARSLAIALVLVPAALARAQQTEGDTVYGRFDGDLVISAGIGGGIAIHDRRHPDVLGTTSLELRARLLDTGGIVIAPEWRPEGDSRVILGIDLRPLFLVRFLLLQESGDRYLDLFVDSIGIDLGAAITPLDQDLGLAIAFGWGLDVPLWIPERGLGGSIALRLSGRYVGALPGDQLAPRGGTDDVALLGVLTIRWSADLGIAAREPPRYRDPER